MKYGVIVHKTTTNIGDDIQSYAAAKLLPQVDYYLPREELSAFQSEGNEPVATIMNAWWMWKKWNWPPAECVYPLMTSMHINKYGVYSVIGSSPIQNEWLQGIGGDYFRAYGPVGCRDYSTLELLEENGIEAYHSGCLTLVLPKQKTTPDAGQYVCLVDLKPALEEKAREYLAGTGLEIKSLSHFCDYKKSAASMEERFQTVEEFLTFYQNARMIITRRLHVTLPCLALGTPVISVVNLDLSENYTRWESCLDWINYISEQDFLSENFDYDFNNPPANKNSHIEAQQAILEKVKDFIEQTKEIDASIEEIRKTDFTEEEARRWQMDLMQWTLDAWLPASRKLLRERNKYRKDSKELKRLRSKARPLHRKILGRLKRMLTKPNTR